MQSPPLLFSLLSEPVRWQLVTALGLGDWMIQELATRLCQPINLVSYHVAKLKAAGLVRERRSSLDGRARYCSLNLRRLEDLYASAGQALPGRGLAPLQRRLQARMETGQSLCVLFLCTHNAARSQMAEALLRDAVRGRWVVQSAGSQPAGVHPLAVTTLAQRQIDIHQHTSKTVTALGPGMFDLVITLCDRVRAEPIRLTGRPLRQHWSLPDPLARPRRAQPKAFSQTADTLAERIGWLLRGTEFV
jgi:protein-tyrosine-phosphatase